MSVYIDTAILVKSYILEANSQEAVTIIEAAGDPLLFSHIHEIEIPNAIRLKRFRGEITEAEEAEAIRILRADIEAGRLLRPAYDLDAVYTLAGRLSAQHSGTVGSRSLDLLHVATALQCGCNALASFDERQRKVAILAGARCTAAIDLRNRNRPSLTIGRG